MASFVNQLASDVWTDADIQNRVQAIIRAEVSAEDELKAARLHRQGERTDDENDFIVRVDTVISAAVVQGRAARADMALLQDALDYESGLAMEVSQDVLDLVAQRAPQVDFVEEL